MTARSTSAGVIAGLAALALALVAAVTIWLLVPTVQTDLAVRATAALEAARIEGVTVTIDGRTATLTGYVEDDATRAVAVSAVAGVIGVSSVVDQLQSGGAAETPSLYRFGAIWDGRTLSLSGFMPSRDAREDVVTHSRDTLPSAEIVDGLQVAPNTPDANWQRIAEAGIAAMRQLSTASLTMVGTQVDFKGVAPADADREFALDILERLPAPYASKIDITVGQPAPAPATAETPQASGYRFGLAYDGVSVALSGALPSPEIRTAMRGAIVKAVPDIKIDDRTKIDPGAPDGAWADAALLLAGQLGKTSSATLALNGRTARLTVLVPSDADKTALAAALADLPVAYATTLDATVAGQVAAAPQTFGGEGSPAYACQIGFDETLRDNAITFASGKSVLPEAAAPVIERLAELARTCPEARLAIGGHTDASGPAAGNEKISAARAKAVAAALAEKGVASARLSARGFGSSRPVAGNETDDDKARNRRIEVTVRP